MTCITIDINGGTPVRKYLKFFKTPTENHPLFFEKKKLRETQLTRLS